MAKITLDAFPLGLRQEAQYEQIAVDLSPGDRVVFCSDGIIEAEDGEGNVFGFEHTAETICQACREGLSAEATIDYILNAVSEFTDDAQQSDDMTCVVLCVA